MQFTIDLDNFYDRDNETENVLVFPGNHDCNTIYGWYKTLDDDHKWNRSSYKKCTTDNSAKFIRLIGDVSETMDEAVDALYDDYMLHKGSQSTIIINKKLYKEGFQYDLFDGLAERYGLRFYGWRYTEPVEYGNYYMIQFQDFSC